MGKSSNSHGKRSDKETQSPMLKIFREIMQRENVNPEKAKLLKEKRKNKKRKQYSTSKSDVGDSSANEHARKAKMQFNVQQQERNRDYNQSQHTHSYPYQSDKKDSWWFWGGSKDDNPKNDKDDTCSCVSCALKRIVGNEYACVGCLLCLFTISVIFAFLLVCKTLPMSTEKLEARADESGPYNNVAKNKGTLDSDSMKKTIEMLRDKKDFGSSLRDRRGGDTSSLWDDSLSRQLGELGLSDLTETDIGDSSLREADGMTRLLYSLRHLLLMRC